MAEDRAIEDTLYQLGRALHAEQLSLERFVKVRRAPATRSHSIRGSLRGSSSCVAL